jgi:hypothetical protein
MELSYNTIQNFLHGRPCKLRVVEIERLCDIYHADEDTRRHLRQLVTEANEATESWWRQNFRDLVTLNRYDVFIGLEQTATVLSEFQPVWIPGLLQTGTYVDAMTGWGSHLSAEERATEVQLRMQRQDRLTGADAPEVSFLLDESILYRPIGGLAAFVDQLQHLIDMSRLPNVSIRVVPQSIGMYAGITLGTSVIFDFGMEPSVVYLELPVGALYLEMPDQVDMYRRGHAAIVAVSLDEEDTRVLVSEAKQMMEKRMANQ